MDLSVPFSNKIVKESKNRPILKQFKDTNQEFIDSHGNKVYKPFN